MDLVAHDIDARDGTRLRLWELGPEHLPGGTTADAAGEAVLFFHGAITSSRGVVAPPTRGRQYSWMHAAAKRGQNAYALDVRGYGYSEQPEAFEKGPEGGDPSPRARQAALDAADALEEVASRWDRVHLVPISWGTMYSGLMLSGEHPEIDPEIEDLVDSLTFVAPVYIPAWDWYEMAPAMGISADLGAYFVRDKETVKEGQGNGDLFQATWQVQVDSNQGIDDEHYLAPAGAQADIREATQGNPAFEPEHIDVPTFVLRGSGDVLSTRPDALTIYDGIATDGLKEYMEITESDHYVMHSNYRHLVFDEVYDFQQRAHWTND